MSKKVLVVILATLIAHVPDPGFSVMAQAATGAQQVQRQVYSAGVGASVALELVDRQKNERASRAHKGHTFYDPVVGRPGAHTPGQV